MGRVLTTQGSPAGALNFARGAATVDPLGEPAAAGAPRFDRPQALISPTDSGTAINTLTDQVQVAGYDDDRLRMFERNAGSVIERVITFLGPPGDEENAVEGVTKRTATFSSTQGHPGINGPNGVLNVANKKYDPRMNGGVSRNLFVISGPVTGSAAAEGEFFIAVSTDDEASWSILLNDDSAGEYEGSTRGLLAPNNIVSGPYIMADENGDRWCFFGLTDYRSNLGATFISGSGKAWLVGAKEQENGDWGEVSLMLVADNDEQPVPASTQGHKHCIGAMLLDVGGVPTLCAVVAQGDTAARNVTFIRTCPLSEWRKSSVDGSQIEDANATGSQWSAVQQIHGGAGTAAETDKLWGWQPVGMAPGKNCTSLLMGGDVNKSAGVWRLDAADYNATKGGFDRVHRLGFFGNDRATRVNCFQVGVDPRLNGSFVAPISDGEPSPIDSSWAIYSADGIYAGRTASGAIAVRGEYIYTVDSSAVRRRARPTVISGRPLCLSPGGDNLVQTPLTKHFNTSSPDMQPLTAGDLALIPGRPSMVADAHILKAELLTGTDLDCFNLGEWYIGQSIAAGNLFCRMLHTPIDPRPDLPYFILQTQSDFKDKNNGGTGIFQTKNPNSDVPGEWQSQIFTGVNPEVDAPQNIKMRWLPIVPNDSPRRARHAFIVDQLSRDRPCGYPLPPGASGQPDETIDVELDPSWGTILGAVGVPSDQWDRHSGLLPAQTSGSDKGLVLARVEGDADNYIEIGLICECGDATERGNIRDEIVLTGLNGGVPFRVAAQEPSANSLTVLRGSSILFGLSHDDVNLVVTGYVDGIEATSASVALGAFAVKPTRLKTASASDYWPVNLWGFADEPDALGAAEMETALQELRFVPSGGIRRRARARDANAVMGR